MLQDHAISIFKESIKSVRPEYLIPGKIIIDNDILSVKGYDFKLSSYDNIYVIGAGKASAYMAHTLEDILGDYITKGFVTVKYAHSFPCKKIKISEAGHPVPDENCIKATQKILTLVDNPKENDLVFLLLSGGGSALMEALPAGINLTDLQKLTNILMSCGADIKEINTIRKHISLVKGGQLAQKIYPATCLTLIISDVPGDNLESIASGPTAPDNSTFADAINIANKYNLSKKLPSVLMDYLQAGIEGKVPETLKAGGRHFDKVHNFIIGNNTLALQAAKTKAESLGYVVSLLDAKMQGDVREMADKIVKKLRHFSKAKKPQCLLFGGETTVTIKGQGKGGRNQELALAAFIALKDYIKPYILLSCGTDGSDGPTDAAGAIIYNDLWEKVKSENIDSQEYLQNNDSYHFFERIEGLIRTGPTGTNVMDIVVVLLE